MYDDVANLNWKGYAKYSDILADNNSTHFIYPFEQEPEQLFINFENWLLSKSYGIKHYSTDTYDKLLQFFSNTDSPIGLAFVVSNCLVIRFFDKKLQVEIENYFVNNDAVDSYGEVEHKIEKFAVNGRDIIGSCKTGVLSSDIDLLPNTFMYFRKGRHVIGKALLDYFATEIGDCIPTIKMIEINESSRGQKLGQAILSSIEKWVYDNGFTRIRSEDLRSYGFWRKMGYEIDLDEGEKYLDKFDYE